MSSYNVTFQNSQTRGQPPLSSSDLFIYQLAKWVQILSAFISIVALFGLGGYYIWLRSQPYWSTESIPPHLVAQKVSEYQAARKAYIETVHLLNQRLRFDLTAAPLLLPTTQGIQLDSIHYQTVYGDKGLEGSIILQGLSTKNDVEAVKQYLQTMRQNMIRFLPERKINMLLKETKPEKRTGYLLFSCIITIQ